MIRESSLFTEWAEELEGNDLLRSESAIEKILSLGVVTSSKNLGAGLYEKKWKSGLRFYFSVILSGDDRSTLLLLGSLKGRLQERAIAECRRQLRFLNVFNGDIKKRD